MAGLYNNYNPYLQGYTPSYTNYSNQNFNSVPTPTPPLPQTSLTYATEEEVRGMRLGYNSQFVAFDKEKPIIYIKSTDSLGGSTTEKFEYKKIDNTPKSEDTTQYVLKEDLKNLVTKDDLAGLVKKEDINNLVSKDELEKMKSIVMSLVALNSKDTKEGE